jgi:rhodanese-related sulfurtransferase
LAVVLAVLPSSALWTHFDYGDSILPPENLDLAEFLNEMHSARSSNERIVVIDLRDPTDFKSGHIPGAIEVDRDMRDVYALQRAKPTRIIVYCYDSFCSRSSYMARRFRRAIDVPVEIYHGGWAEWASSGLPIEL